MPRFFQIALSLSILALIIGVPAWYASHRHARYRNFRVVEEGVLYRSGQMTVEGLRHVVETRGIKSVINLRDGLTEAESLEAAYCLHRGVNYVSIQQKPWSAADQSVPNEESVRKFIDVMSDPANYPVLLHCFAGHHRTGAFCAIYRMQFQNWTPSEAIREMYNLGYRTIEEDLDVCRYLKGFEPRK